MAGNFSFGDITSSMNIDDLTGMGFYSVTNIQADNIPTPYGVLLCFQTKGWYRRLQVFFSSDAPATIQYRGATSNGTWGSWKKFAES